MFTIEYKVYGLWDLDISCHAFCALAKVSALIQILTSAINGRHQNSYSWLQTLDNGFLFLGQIEKTFHVYDVKCHNVLTLQNLKLKHCVKINVTIYITNPKVCITLFAYPFIQEREDQHESYGMFNTVETTNKKRWKQGRNGIIIVRQNRHLSA